MRLSNRDSVWGKWWEKGWTAFFKICGFLRESPIYLEKKHSHGNAPTFPRNYGWSSSKFWCRYGHRRLVFQTRRLFFLLLLLFVRREVRFTRLDNRLRTGRLSQKSKRFSVLTPHASQPWNMPPPYGVTLELEDPPPIPSEIFLWLCIFIFGFFFWEFEVRFFVVVCATGKM